MNVQELIVKTRELDAKATPGPWIILATRLADMLERAMEELESVRASSSFRIRQDAADAIDEIEAMAEGGEA